MSKAVNAKVMGKIGKSRALRVHDQTCIHIYSISHLYFSDPIYKYKHRPDRSQIFSKSVT